MNWLHQSSATRACRCSSPDGSPLNGEVVLRLFHDVHEDAAVLRCGACGRHHLRYFAEVRDDGFDHACEVGTEEVALLKASRNQRDLVRSMLRRRRVYIRCPWRSGWFEAGATIAEPRPA